MLDTANPSVLSYVRTPPSGAAAVIEGDRYARGILDQVVDLHAQPDADRRRAYGRGQDVMQHRPQDAAALLHGLRVRWPRRLEQRLAAARAATHSAADEAARPDLIEHAQIIKGPQRDARDADACSVDPPLGIRIDQVDVQAGTPQRDRSAHAPHPTTDDERGAAHVGIFHNPPSGCISACGALPGMIRPVPH